MIIKMNLDFDSSFNLLSQGIGGSLNQTLIAYLVTVILLVSLLLLFSITSIMFYQHNY